METNVKVMHAQRDDELFDVVDENDVVIGQSTRAEVHARKLLHRAVHVLVFNARGEIFLQKRSMLKDTAPGRWATSCSGHVDSGEDYDASAIRELEEEIGVKVDRAPERILRIEARAETGWEFVWIYRMEYEGPFVLHPAEIDSGGWFTPASLDQLIEEDPRQFARAFVFIWRQFRAKG